MVQNGLGVVGHIGYLPRYLCNWAQASAWNCSSYNYHPEIRLRLAERFYEEAKSKKYIVNNGVVECDLCYGTTQCTNVSSDSAKCAVELRYRTSSTSVLFSAKPCQVEPLAADSSSYRNPFYLSILASRTSILLQNPPATSSPLSHRSIC
jgi:hypothetical protein